MLKEVESARQEDPLRHRRWFADDFFDLIVWYDPDGRLDGFQLCYNKSFDEHAFTWRRDSGFPAASSAPRGPCSPNLLGVTSNP